MMRKKIYITLGIICGALYAISSASSILFFSTINDQSLADKVSSVHFMAPGNNFVGSIFWLPTKSISPITIHINGGNHQKTCTKLVRGLYFNSQRGKRIRPLDQETLTLLQAENPNYDNLHLSGGLYTTCDSGSNYGIFGAITYSRSGTLSYIVAGAKINYPQNKLFPTLSNNFQYFDNKVPMGYLYDSNGGIGYVGGVLSGHENLINFLSGGGCIQSGFVYSGTTIIANQTGRETQVIGGNTAMQTMRNLIIQGSVGLSKSIDKKERLSLLGNFENKTVIYNGSDINSSTLINIAKQNAQQLCQGKQLYTPEILEQTNENILCIQNHNLTIDLSDTSFYENKTIIVKSGSVILQGGMEENSPALDLFIDKGLLYLPTDTSFVGQTFTTQGFPGIPATTSGLYLKGNFIINGLLIGGTPDTTATGFAHKLHLQGKITTLNTPLQASAGRIEQINDMFDSTEYNNFINLQNIFVRTCGLGGTGSDNTPCSTGGIISTTPLVILNGNYPSNLLQ